MEKCFSADAIFQDLKVVRSRCSVCMSPLWIFRDEKTKQLLFMRSRFIFVHVDKCKFFLKNNGSNWCSFPYFCGGHKNNFVYSFVDPRLQFA